MLYSEADTCSGEVHFEPRCSRALGVATCVVLAILVVTTATANILTLRAFIKLKHSANNTFFLNLAFVYTLVALLVQPFSIYLVGVQSLQEPLPWVGGFLCQVTGSLFEVAIYASLFSLTSISLDRYAIVFFPLKYKCQINRTKVHLWNVLCWSGVLVMIVPVAASYAFATHSLYIYSTHNSTTVCQGRYWFMDAEHDRYSKNSHVFVYLLASIYIVFFGLSLAPNLAVIIKLNHSNYKLECSISNSLPCTSVDPSTMSLTDMGMDEFSTPLSLRPSSCYESMKAPSPSSPLIERPVIPGNKPRKKASLTENGGRKSLSTPALKIPDRSSKKLSFADMPKSMSATSMTTPTLEPEEDPLKYPHLLTRSTSKQKFQATVKSSMRKVSNANTFIVRDKLFVSQRKTHQAQIRRKKQRSIVITLMIMCLVCLMSTGLYGAAVFSVNLREHDHSSLFTMYINFFAPFLMFLGMLAIPTIHFWRNANLRRTIQIQLLQTRDWLMGIDRNAIKTTSDARSSRYSMTFWAS